MIGTLISKIMYKLAERQQSSNHPNIVPKWCMTPKKKLHLDNDMLHVI